MSNPNNAAGRNVQGGISVAGTTRVNGIDVGVDVNIPLGDQQQQWANGPQLPPSNSGGGMGSNTALIIAGVLGAVVLLGRR